MRGQKARLPSRATVEAFAKTTKAIKETANMLVDNIIREEKASAKRRPS